MATRLITNRLHDRKLIRSYDELLRAWAKAAKELRTPEECTAATVEAMEAKGDKLDATGKALVSLLKLAPQKRQVVYCLGCRYAILPNEPVEVIELAMTGCINCNRKSTLYDFSCKPCGIFMRRKAYISDLDFHMMRDKE